MTRPTSTSWIILTTGSRPEELATAVASILAQTVPPDEILIIGNGADPGSLPGARTIALDENLGISGGRNAGARAATGDIVFFLDDDAHCADDTVAQRVLDLFDQRPDLAVITMRITDADDGSTQRRHVPRLRADDAMRSGDVTTFLGGASAIRRTDFLDRGEYAAEFFYSMEETDLAWRLLDHGRSLHYLAEAEVHHPATVPARHSPAFEFTARNRVWTAHRRLPRILAVTYVAVWTVLMLVRAPSMPARRDTVRGIAAGIRQRTPRPIERMSWQTVWRMARLGRPPII